MPTTAEAVRALRTTFNEPQQKFSSRLQLSIASVAHWEIGLREPDSWSARKLYLAAVSVHRTDLAQAFAKLIAEDLEAPDFWDVHIESESEHWAIRSLQLVLRDQRFKKQREQILKALAPVEKELREAEAHAIARMSTEEMATAARRQLVAQLKSGSLRPPGWGPAKKRKE